MVRLEVQKAVVEKALKENHAAFEDRDGEFQWTGTTRVKSKQSGRAYDVVVDISVQPTRRTKDQIAACLLKPDLRFEDLLIVSMIDSRIPGHVKISGLPGKDVEHDFMKFLKSVGAAK